MARITVVGVGPGPTSYLTKEVESEPLRAEKLFFRTGAHPAYEWLRGQSKHFVSFDKLYDTRWTNPGDIYEFMVAALFKEAALGGEAVYAVPGSPQRAGGYDKADSRARSKRGSRGEVLPGVSFLDQVPAEINFDFSLACR